MKTSIKISKTATNFFTHSFKGDGKYYTTEQGSKSYRCTIFYNFYARNMDCVDILDRGNDAPRGGKTGSYLIVRFNEIFTKRYGDYLSYLELEKENKKIALENEKQERAESEAKAKVIFEEYLTEEKKESLKVELANRNSQKGKSFLKMKSINKTGDYRNYYLLEKMIYA